MKIYKQNQFAVDSPKPKGSRANGKLKIKTMKSILFFIAGFSMALIFCDMSDHGQSLEKIEHIQNVDEMQPTPEEIYFFTDKAKYKFDGEKVIFITEIPQE